MRAGGTSRTAIRTRCDQGQQLDAEHRDKTRSEISGFLFLPSDEQRAIVDHIRIASVKLEAVHTATDGTVKLLKERRAALIAAPVTGRIDIRATS